jgi:hypothetical protein
MAHRRHRLEYPSRESREVPSAWWRASLPAYGVCDEIRTFGLRLDSKPPKRRAGTSATTEPKPPAIYCSFNGIERTRAIKSSNRAPVAWFLMSVPV